MAIFHRFFISVFRAALQRVELFEQIRREYEFGVGTISGVSRKLQVHRRLVREALSSAVPPERKPPARKLRKLQAARAMIDAILVADRQAPLSGSQ